MKIYSQALSVLLPTFYLLVIFYYGHILFGRSKQLEKHSNWILIVLLIVHATEIILRGLAIGTIPLATKFDALSFLSLIIVIVYLIIELTVKNKATGFFTLTLAFIIQSVSSVLYSWDLTFNPLLKNPVYAVHVVFTIMGYTAICISALYALMYIMLNHNIRNHHFGVIYEKLPPIELLENMSILSIKIGIITLGIGLALGHLRAGDVLGDFWPLDAKVIFSDLIWVVYTVGYIIAQLRKWRGKWMAYLCLTGFAVLILTNVTILFIENTFHQFH